MTDMDNARYVKRGRVGGVEWMRSYGASPKGLIIAPPLIGGHALQQIRLFRPLVRHHLDLFSFSYSGHGASNGAFSLQVSLDNCLAALDLALAQSYRDGLPLFGIASCFATVPLMHAVRKRGEPLAKMVLINALPHLRWEEIAIDFYRYFRTHRQWRPTIKGLKAALQRYRDELLPSVTHGHQAFGILPRHRVHWTRVIWELFNLRRYDFKPLRSTPVLCVYGRHDRLLQQIGFTNLDSYEALIESLCPQSRFLRLNSDHFFTGVRVRQQLLFELTQFLLIGPPYLKE